jgi:hypothetical protein
LQCAQKILFLCLNADSCQGVIPYNKFVRNTCQAQQQCRSNAGTVFTG